MKKAITQSFFWGIICIVFINVSYAQTTTIQGIVMDETTKEPLIAATIATETTGTVSDFDGSYVLKLAVGNHRLEVNYIGYETQFLDITLIENQPQTINISLLESINLLQTATVSGGRYEKPLGETTVSLDVLKPELLESNNTTAVDQILNKIPGVNIVGGQANIRGGSGFSYGAGSRVMLLIDDIPALQADSGSPNWTDVPIENVAQIEVIKGAASALYGSAALNGIINVRTAYAKSEPVTKASTFYTIYDAPSDPQKHWWRDTSVTPHQVGASFAHRQKFKKLDVVTSAFFTSHEKFNRDTYERYGRATLGLRYRATDRFSFGLNGNINVGKNQNFFYWKDAEAGAYEGNPTSFSQTNKTRYMIDPFVTYFDKSGNRHKFQGRLYSINNQAINNQSNSSNLLYGEYQFQRTIKPIGLIVTSGILTSYTKVSADLYNGETIKSRNAAGYLQLEKRFADQLTISGGVRYEYNALIAADSLEAINPNSTSSEGRPIFRIGANYQPFEYTYFRASWGQGYRYPTIAEKFISTDVGFLIVPNYDLTSETGWSAEFGIKQGFKISNWQGFMDISAFWSQYQNMMEFAFVPQFLGFSSQNIGDTDIKGIDFSVMGQGKIASIPTTLIAGYTYIDPQFQEFTRKDSLNSSADYNILKYRFKHTWKFDIESQFGAFNVGIAGFYNSNMEAIDFVFEGFIPGLRDYRRENNTGSTVFDLRVGYTFGKQNKVSFLVKNILNKEYTLRPALLEAPRNFTLRLEKTF